MGSLDSLFVRFLGWWKAERRIQRSSLLGVLHKARPQRAEAQRARERSSKVSGRFNGFWAGPTHQERAKDKSYIFFVQFPVMGKAENPEIISLCSHPTRPGPGGPGKRQSKDVPMMYKLGQHLRKVPWTNVIPFSISFQG